MSEDDSVLRLYLDADVDVKLAANLRKRGFDCISAREVGNDALSDEAQMVFATNEHRTLLTHNIQDFVPIFERWWYAERNHSGIIVSQQIPLGELQRRVIRLLDAITTVGMKNNLRNLGEFADRNRR
jgi:predicted nuclease of predicted toxin-antitoxin system